MSKLIYSSIMGKDSFKIESGDTIFISLVSVFDSFTNETDLITCTFDINEFVLAINVLKENGSCSIQNESSFLKIDINSNGGCDIELSALVPMERTFTFNDENFTIDAIKF